MSTYRERREAKADRLEEWAAKREPQGGVVTASERIRAARLQKDKAVVGALDQNPVETREGWDVGSRVSYEDMANPRQVGTITEIEFVAGGGCYHVEWDDGGSAWSDLRQCGWKPA